MFASLRRGRKLYEPLKSFAGSQRGIFSGKGGYQHFGAKTPKRSWMPSPQTGIAIVGGGAYIYLTNRQEIPYTHRKHFILIPVKTERALGQATFDNVTSDAKRKGLLLPQHARESERVRRIGLEVADITANGKGGGFVEHMKLKGIVMGNDALLTPHINDVYALQDIKWEFAVIKSEQANAFVAPSGKVVVFTGLLDMIQGDDSQLAAVLSHEAGHTLARHVAEKLTWHSFSILAWFLIYAGTGFPVPEGLLATAIDLPNSRKLESEADAIGLSLAAQACYKPGSAADVFQKFDAMEKKQGAHRIPAFLRTHPMNEARIKAIQKNLPAANELFNASGCQQTQSAFRSAFRQQRSSWSNDDGFF